ncbi:beta-ketoacyl synthase N-terminal-like domain-containing protein [Actinophytocola sp. NPDC049390]|uniref:beta-ketoacyl synthase N-terminal-like domain-containing protein n=1 Tax=Actinophytocola sp. NPDC049390 TaxID=3363894 RepID=UPI0037B53589
MRDYTGDEIAVVGMAGRFPGAQDVPELWRALLDGTDAMHDHTDEELRELGLHEELIADPALVRGHGRLAGVGDFDADFFGVPGDEAAAMDPQQRLFLEQSWVALQDAGVDPVRDRRTVGVFAGASANRYFLHRLAAGEPPADWEARLATGWSPDYLPAQVAYRLGLTGPAIAVQTACSSSLVAVCTAAQSLLDFRCDLALAGGVSVTEPRFRHTDGGLVSPDGRCRAFDAAGQGSGFGSGVGVVVLARLADALEHGDQVYAVLCGWAVNNDGGARAGFAAPGRAGQTGVVTEALAGAGIDPATIGMVEAHGSGTRVGDALEVAALTRAFRAAGDTRAEACGLGSVKTNLGNLDAAAGITGLVKAVLAVRDGVLPASLHHQEPAAEANLPASPFFVPVKTVGWPAGTGPRRAGVSSFGLGGTNAHVIVEQAPPEAPRPPAAGPFPLAVSARTPEALRELAARIADRLDEPDPPRLDDVARTLATGRAAGPHRAVVACGDHATAVAGLRRLAAGEPVPADGVPAFAAEWAAGADVDLSPLADPAGTRVVSLPHHPLHPVRHWLEVRS